MKPIQIAAITDDEGNRRIISYNPSDGCCYLDGDTDALDMHYSCQGDLDASYEYICASWGSWEFEDLHIFNRLLALLGARN